MRTEREQAGGTGHAGHGARSGHKCMLGAALLLSQENCLKDAGTLVPEAQSTQAGLQHDHRCCRE